MHCPKLIRKPLLLGLCRRSFYGPAVVLGGRASVGPLYGFLLDHPPWYSIKALPHSERREMYIRTHRGTGVPRS